MKEEIFSILELNYWQNIAEIKNELNHKYTRKEIYHTLIELFKEGLIHMTQSFNLNDEISLEKVMAYKR